MSGCLKTGAMSIGTAFLLSIFQDMLGTTYLSEFLRGNLISLLIALLAVNSATLGVVLTKIRDIADRHGKVECFKETRREMVVSIHEQLSLIICGTLFLMIEKSTLVAKVSQGELTIKVLIISVFIYAMAVLYDTAKSVFSILDFEIKG